MINDVNSPAGAESTGSRSSQNNLPQNNLQPNISPQINVAQGNALPAHNTGFPFAYHEMNERHVGQADALEQLKANIAQLEELHSRMRFMMSEVRALLKKA